MDEHDNQHQDDDLAPEQGTTHAISAEANLLRLPIFALDTKRLKTLDMIECVGTHRRGNQTHQFRLEVSRNTKTLYPGPLARSAHIAILDVATQQGVPIQNPIVFRWRDLCRRMGINGSGRSIRRLRDAITATAGLMITSENALYLKDESGEGQYIRPQKGKTRLLHLYRQVEFVSERREDGTVADINAIWLDDWYLANLNNLYAAPLDYELWRWLDKRSTIASRMYEFLFINFFSGTPVLNIYYRNLAQFLPIKPERYYSDARKQMDDAFKLTRKAKLTGKVQWEKRPQKLALLRIHPGVRLLPEGNRDTNAFNLIEEHIGDNIEVNEVRRPAEWHIVSEWYTDWTGRRHNPTANEVDQVRAYIDRFGLQATKDMIKKSIPLIRQKWPAAKSFGAVDKYIDELHRPYVRKREERHREQQAAKQRRRERAEREQVEAANKREEERFVALWETLPEHERHELLREARSNRPMFSKYDETNPFLRSILKGLLADRVNTA